MGINIFNLFGNFSGNSLIPNRDPGSVSGSEFINNNINNSGSKRESNILDEFMHGNIPNFLRNFKSITVSFDTDSITYLVMSDYLSIGNDSDYIRMPMNPKTAQLIADKYDCSLPTKKMVNDIWKNSVKLTPLPWGAPYDQTMYSTNRIALHNSKIQKQLNNYKDLLSGHKKDVILTNQLAPNNPNKKVAIYGWIQSNGKPIQGLNAFSHDDLYEDYSHGIRLISKDVLVNGNYMRLDDVFTNNKLASLVSDEGKLIFTRY